MACTPALCTWPPARGSAPPCTACMKTAVCMLPEPASSQHDHRVQSIWGQGNHHPSFAKEAHAISCVQTVRSFEGSLPHSLQKELPASISDDGLHLHSHGSPQTALCAAPARQKTPKCCCAPAQVLSQDHSVSCDTETRLSAEGPRKAFHSCAASKKQVNKYMATCTLSRCMVNEVLLLQEGLKGRDVYSVMPAQMQLLQHAPPHVLQCNRILHFMLSTSCLHSHWSQV